MRDFPLSLSLDDQIVNFVNAGAANIEPNLPVCHIAVTVNIKHIGKVVLRQRLHHKESTDGE